MKRTGDHLNRTIGPTPPDDIWRRFENCDRCGHARPEPTRRLYTEPSGYRDICVDCSLDLFRVAAWR